MLKGRKEVGHAMLSADLILAQILPDFLVVIDSNNMVIGRDNNFSNLH